MTHIQMIKRSIKLFPRTDYTDARAVRHVRRGWADAIQYLRCRPEGSKWILDQKQVRQ